ncbi:MAG: hypothetical protein ACE5G3_11185 [Gammaproteobacteria bacterium]
MKVTTQSVISMLLAATVVGAGTAVADSHRPSWQDYRSAYSSIPVSKSYNDIEVSKYDIDKTRTTTTTTSTDDSYNTANIDKSRRSAELNLDKSRRVDDSYNTDNSKHAADSFNKSIALDLDKSSRIKDSYNTDKSRRARDSFNTDNSKYASESFNTDKSVNDSYNTANNQRRAAITDAMSVSQLNKSIKDVSSGDVQGASNQGQLNGARQRGYQGSTAIDVGGIGNDAPSYGYGGCCGSEYGHGGSSDQRQMNNRQEIGVYGPNLGAVSNTSVVNQGRDLVFGPNRSAIGNDFGNKQIFSAGDQTQLMKNDQFKSGDNAASAVDNVTNTATKSSSTTTN